MEFKRNEISGQLVADGERGQYWIDEQAWTYVTMVYVDKTGPKVDKIGTFNNVEDAIKFCNGVEDNEDAL